MPEKNHHARTLLPGKVICNFGQSILDCVVRRISDHGATVEVESPFGIPRSAIRARSVFLRDGIFTPG